MTYLLALTGLLTGFARNPLCSAFTVVGININMFPVTCTYKWSPTPAAWEVLSTVHLMKPKRPTSASWNRKRRSSHVSSGNPGLKQKYSF